MECFLSVGQGSTNESRFLELHYKSSDQSPVCLVGKGMSTHTLTFIQLFHYRGGYHIETSPLVRRANQRTGFYMGPPS